MAVYVTYWLVKYFILKTYSDHIEKDNLKSILYSLPSHNGY